MASFEIFKIGSKANILTFMIVVSNLEAIQSQLKYIYTNTLSTLCPLPWLEKSEDVQYKFDDVFIPLRTTDIAMQQKTNDLPGSSSERRDGQGQGQTDDVPGFSGSRIKSMIDMLWQRISPNISNTSKNTPHTRYKCDNKC